MNELTVSEDTGNTPVVMSETATPSIQYVPEQMPNRATRRAMAKQGKQHLSSKVKVVRGKTYYGGEDITELMSLGIFKHAVTAYKAKMFGITPDFVRAEMKAEKEANTVSVDIETCSL